ncbi:MAG: cache domain-containing protein [Acidobacteria bacterium]|nr:cache domain-containing protein [Acidobacteriota bacterium]
MTSLAISVTATAFGWLVLAGVFILVLRARWLAKLRAGFFVSMLLAMMGVALMSASVVGVWGYEAARRILDRQISVELQDVGEIVESRVAQIIGDISTRLGSFGASIAPLVNARASAGQLQDQLRTIRNFYPGFLQMEIFDSDGRPVAVSSAAVQQEETNRVAVAFGLDGRPFVSEARYSAIYKRQVIAISVPLGVGSGPVVGVVVVWYDLRIGLDALVKVAKFNQSGYAVMADGDGRILAHPDVSRVNEDISSYPAIQLARQSGKSGTVTALNARRESRLFGYRPIPNPGTLARQPWILLTEIDESEQLALLLTLRRELVVGVVLVLLAGLLVAQQVSRSIQQPMHELSDFAHRIGSGDMTGRVALGGHDVAGRLAASLNEMAAGLQERDHVKEVFGRYVATQVSAQILDGQVNLGGDSRRVTILFSDIRSFTAMAEQMTPSQVVSFLNDYFSEMVDAVFEQNGMLDKFLGDGLMAVFGAFGDTPDHPRRAVLAALRMKALLAKINGERAMAGKPPIAIGIGIHSDDVIVGNIGSRKRLEFTVVGDGVNVSSRLQTLNKEFGTTILVSETTFEALKDEFECRQMPDTPLRGKHKELRFYEVVSVKAGASV